MKRGVRGFLIPVGWWEWMGLRVVRWVRVKKIVGINTLND